MQQPNLFETQLETSLLKKISKIHNSIYANDGLSAQQALDEMLKILFIRILRKREIQKTFFKLLISGLFFA